MMVLARGVFFIEGEVLITGKVIIIGKVISKRLILQQDKIAKIGGILVSK